MPNARRTSTLFHLTQHHQVQLTLNLTFASNWLISFHSLSQLIVRELLWWKKTKSHQKTNTSWWFDYYIIFELSERIEPHDSGPSVGSRARWPINFARICRAAALCHAVCMQLFKTHSTINCATSYLTSNLIFYIKQGSQPKKGFFFNFDQSLVSEHPRKPHKWTLLRGATILAQHYQIVRYLLKKMLLYWWINICCETPKIKQVNTMLLCSVQGCCS